jgi:AcrR family transcriptional regulator
VSFSYQPPRASVGDRDRPKLLGHRNGWSRDEVTGIQRARLLTAALDAVQELGYPRATVAEIIRRAGVSRKTFYDTFSGREDCFLALLEQTIAQAAFVVGAAYDDSRHWRTGIRSALSSLLVLMQREPALARLWLVEALKGGDRVLARRAQAVGHLANLIGEGRAATKSAYEPPDAVAEGVVGGVLEILHARVLSSSDAPLTDLLGPLMYMIVLPYLGERVARGELDKPGPKATPSEPDRAPATGGDPLEGLDMRLTYRTVRVLVVIGARPGASNREIAEASCVIDQGQISKLLSRLARLELIENRGPGQANGGANAWQLTQRGKYLVKATQPPMSLPA